MGWKNLSSWVKWVIISLILTLIFSIIYTVSISEFLCEYNDMGDIVCSTSQILDTFLKVLPWVVLILLIPFFIIGALIVWIIGKFKNNKNKK